jgi:hypothetical protein
MVSKNINIIPSKPHPPATLLSRSLNDSLAPKRLGRTHRDASKFTGTIHTGNKKPSAQQTERIFQGIRSVGRELSRLEIRLRD